MSNRKYCQDFTAEAERIARRERMQKIRSDAVRAYWRDHLHQLLLVAPLLVFIAVGYLAILLGWI